jgi:hypothetical protein
VALHICPELSAYKRMSQSFAFYQSNMILIGLDAFRHSMYVSHVSDFSTLYDTFDDSISFMCDMVKNCTVFNRHLYIESRAALFTV